MPLIIDTRLFSFRYKKVYFAETLCDVEDCDAVAFPFHRKDGGHPGFDESEKLTSIIDLDQPLDKLWERLDRNVVKKYINRALREGLEVHQSRAFEEFYRMADEFVRLKGYGSLLSKEVPELENMRKHGVLFVFEHDGEMLAGDLYIEDRDHLMLWASASRRLDVDKQLANTIGRANRLIHWMAIQYAHEKGIREYDWAGVWPAEEAQKDPAKLAINSFKLGFGGDVATRYTYRKIYSPLLKTARIFTS